MRERAWHHRARNLRKADRVFLDAFKGRCNQKVCKRLAEAQHRLDAHHGSSSGMAPGPPDGDGFKQVQRRRKPKGPHVKCTKPGCTGTCPRGVVEQGLRGVGFCPAKCRVCDRKYKLVPGTAPAPPSESGQWAGSAGKGLQEQVRALQEELKSLRAGSDSQRVAPKPASAAPEDPALADLKAVREEIGALRALDSKLHGHIHGGYEATLAAAEAKRDNLLATRRGGLPLKEQLARSQAFVEASTRRLEAEHGKAESLAAQQAELVTKVAAQDAAVSAATAKLALAKAELATISAKLSAENGQPASSESPCPWAPGALSQADGGTRQAVADLCAFAANPGVQQALLSAGMPPDQQQRVTAALGIIASGTPRPMGHRPAGTTEAVAAITAEAAQLLSQCSAAPGASPAGLSVGEVLALVPDDPMDLGAKDKLRERLEAEQDAKRLRSA